MMRSYTKKVEFFSAIAVMILGTFLHFVYALSHENFIVSLFAPVNESVWEHLKMIFYPVFLVTIIISIALRHKNLPVFHAHSIAVLWGLVFLIVAYYTYSGILGYSVIAVDVILFYLTVIVIYTIAANLLMKERSVMPYALPGILVFLFMTAIFILFTLYPPKIGIFLPPLE